MFEEPIKRGSRTHKFVSKPPAEETTYNFASMRPEERHIWQPPSAEELESRRQRQKYLDKVAADLERLFMGFNDIFAQETLLESQLRETDSKIQQMEAKADMQMTRRKKGSEEVEQDVQDMHASVKAMDGSLDHIRKKQIAQKKKKDALKARKKFLANEYRQAILLFRNGLYGKSAAKFKSLLKKKYSPRLKDNILFGLASSYYKLNEYDKALLYLNDIIRNHPKGDKWLVSHAVSGLIYNLQGQPGKAIQILETARRHKPNPELLKIIDRLLKIARGGAVDVSS